MIKSMDMQGIDEVYQSVLPYQDPFLIYPCQVSISWLTEYEDFDERLIKFHFHSNSCFLLSFIKQVLNRHVANLNQTTSQSSWCEGVNQGFFLHFNSKKFTVN